MLEPVIKVRLQLTLTEQTFTKLQNLVDTTPTRGNIQAVILEAIKDFLTKESKVE